MRLTRTGFLGRLPRQRFDVVASLAATSGPVYRSREIRHASIARRRVLAPAGSLCATRPVVWIDLSGLL